MSVLRRYARGVIAYDPEKCYNGYTLLWPMGSHDVWLINMEGQAVHRWQMPYPAGLHAVLLPNGNLLGACQVIHSRTLGLPQWFSGFGGLLLEVDWDGNIVWEHKAPYQNHDFNRLSNGNTIYTTWRPEGKLPSETARQLKGGLVGTEFNGEIWGDSFVEVDPEGRIVWEWLDCEHLDPEIDALGPLVPRTQWPYINSVFPLPDGNVLASLRYCCTIVIIDRETGDIIWRWGRGELGNQHDARWTEDGTILVFDNGTHRDLYAPNFSRIVEVDPKTKEVIWEYRSDPPTEFFSAVMGGQDRLPNGNTLICESLTGRLFEVTQSGKKVWEYVSPFYHKWYHHGFINLMYRAYRYGPDFPGLQGKDINPDRYEWTNQLYAEGRGRITRRGDEKHG